jgi:hypothetical protein
MRLLRVAERALIPPFHVMDVLAAANARQRERGDVVSLAVGQPSAGAPKPVIARAQEALAGANLGYTEGLGIPELRAAVANHYEQRHGVAVDPHHVVITTGSSGGFLLAFLAAFDAGDRVAVTRPGYPAYRNILAALGAEVVELPCGADTRFRPTVEMLAEVPPINYWFYEALGWIRGQREEGPFLVLSVWTGEEEDLVRVRRAALGDRSPKEAGYRDAIRNIVLDQVALPEVRGEDLEKAMQRLRRLTGQKFTTRDQWRQWWERHKDELVLSQDNQRLEPRPPL